MKKFFTMLMAVCFMVILLPITVSASVSDNDPSNYNAGDVAAIQKIIEASPTLSEKYDKNDPASWDTNFVSWSNDGTESRVSSLQLRYSDADGNPVEVTDFSGTMDVSGLAFLFSLNCSWNPGLTKLVLPESGSLESLNCVDTGITELDLSAQTNLLLLECYTCEDLAALDISHNTKLTHLDFEQTAVSSIDLSMLTDLVTLWCGSTDITALDVTHNPNLDFLACNDLAISSLDLSNNTVLTYLNCVNTGITDLDLSANTSLAETHLSSSCQEIVIPEGHKISIQQTTGGMLSLSSGDDGSGRVYTLSADCDPVHRLVRFTGVTNKISENGTWVSFNVTGDMALSAEFALSERVLLTALDIEGAQLSPAFSGNVDQYTASVGYDVAQINIRAQGNEEYERMISGDGIHPLEVGANTFVVGVTVPLIPGVSDISNPEETFTNNYTITVTRAENSGAGTGSGSVAESVPTQEPASASELDDVPKTGDNSHVIVWFVLMMIGIMTLTASAVMWRQSKRMK